ncbi:MAG: hypothetical protein LWX56_10105 [Ignavibacteria bacterium]|nr:hypothetical protein [Ignavibacteria bacterium]
MRTYKHVYFVIALVILCSVTPVQAQVTLDGEFRIRWYSDVYECTRDARDKENYMRVFARMHSLWKASDIASVNMEMATVTENPNSPTRNISGTGVYKYAITQLYAELNKTDYWGLDAIRLRAGRQQFQIGNGLVMGESNYYIDRFDGARVDLAYDKFTLTGFGAIYGQNVSASGLYPDPGSDQIYVVKAGAEVEKQELMAYYLVDKPRGDYNDYYILGGGVASSLMKGHLEYFGEFAYQKFNTPDGAPKKHGIGYMAGVAYRFAWGPFKSIKVETKYAAMQGDDSTTADQEIFSPQFPNFFWGERTGYANGVAGGDYPYHQKNLEGCRIWYSRIYFVPKIAPKVRLQFQYTNVNEYKNNDGYNSMDDELAVKLYYTFSSNVQAQFRYGRVLAKDSDYDPQKTNVVTSSKDRYDMNRYMFDLQIQF